MDPAWHRLDHNSANLPDREALRLRPRHRIQTLVYVTLDQGNGGIIRNLSEDGIAIQAVAALRPHQQVRLRFQLLNPKVRIDAVGQVAWANSTGQAGVKFTQVGDRRRQQLKQWLLTNLLWDAAALDSPVFRCPTNADPRTQLILSGEPRPSIQLDSSDLIPAKNCGEIRLEFSWWPTPISVSTFSRLVDGLIVFASVLLFCFVFLAIAHQMPAWPVMLALAVGIPGALILLYWFLFVVQGLGTPGTLLARVAAATAGSEPASEAELTRFR